MNADSKAVAEVVSLPGPVARRGISEAAWRTAMTSLFPGAAAESVLMVFDYCAARKLDPLKKPCHIVPMQIKDAKSGEYFWRDVVMPGIYEYRTTATRTGLYMGHSKPEYGPEAEFMRVPAPQWCELTIYRWNDAAKQRIEFPVRVYFSECVGTSKDKKTGDLYVNARWSRAPIQMLTKVTEAAGLREAFPDELGGTHTEEELVGQVLEVPLNGRGDGSGRPDLSEVDYTVRDKWVGQITDTLNSADLGEYGIAAAIREIDDQLQKFPDLYTAVLDRIAAEKIITKANWNKTLKHFPPEDER